VQIGFIDFSKEERTKILSTLKLLGDQTALDELGIGVVRDAYADLLFPGISTLQTRAKYFVLIPYLFSMAEALAAKGKLCSGQEMLQWLHQAEDRLVPTLVANSGAGELGIIGSTALKQKRSVKMKPSGIYWSGLRSLGILRTEKITLPLACALTVRRAKKRRETELKTDGESYDDLTAADTGETLFLPLHPEYDPEKEASIDLTKKEAEFLEDCITRSFWTRNSMLSFLLKEKLICESFFDIPEDLLPRDLKRDYQLARGFARFIYGAHIRYNVIYSGYTDEAMEAEFHAWRRDFFNEPFALEPILARISCNPQLAWFCSRFLECAKKNDLAAMDELVVNRELSVKGERAKLRKTNEYRYDPGRPIHAYYLDFRFGRASVIIQDILNGLEG